jgi:Fe-S cluster assembly protein SufD
MTAAAEKLSSSLQHYRAEFDARWSGSDDALTRLKRAALDQFLLCGFPTQRHEEWKYTSLRRLEARTFSLPDHAGLTDAADQSQWIRNSGPRIVFLNGHWMQTLSAIQSQPPGVTVLTIDQWRKNSPEEVAAFLASQPGGAGAFEHMNTAFFQDGVVIEISAGASFEEPLYILHQCTTAAQQRMFHPRLLVRSGANSRCTVIEHFVGADEAEYLTNAVASFDVGPGASITHCRLQQESRRSFHVSTVRARLQRDASYQSHDIALGGSLARSNILTLLDGPGATTTLRGLFVPGGTQHIDSYTRIEHVAAHTTSHEEYRGIADGRGRGVFNGKVVVHPNAQQIDARQSSRNLLLSATAEIDTKPELEIYANDVKCSHGATTGQLDATQLFYLRSRGLSESDARTLLIRAFAESILTAIACQSVRQHLEAHIDERFAVGARP